MKYSAYFIDPYGSIIPLTSDRHIHEVMANPDKFGLTTKAIEAVYKKHKEKMGVEGNAREEILSDLLKKGWTRVRYVMNQDAYMVQVFKLDNSTKENLYDWGKSVLKHEGKKAGMTGLTIMEIKPGGKTLRGDVDDLVRFKLFEEMKRTRKSSALMFIEDYIAKKIK